MRVVGGEAAVNTMDAVWFTPAQLAEGWRLGCQVYAVGPLTVEIFPR